jgi:carboxypeptidase T
MTSRILALVVSIAILAATAPIRAGQAGDDPQFRVRIESSNVDALRAWLESAGYDVLGSDAANATVDVAVSRTELHGLHSRGLSIISVERGRPLEATVAAKETRGKQSITAAAVSAGYLNLAGINERLQEIADQYPEIAQLVDVTAAYNAPPTFEGRHIFALRISDNVQLDEDEPAMLVATTHHAREISTPVIALEAAARLTAGYGVDEQITNAVNAHEIWIAPVWNPDGYNYVFTANNLWRKNRRVFSNGVGVDQNRNYPQAWSSSCAGSTSVSSETYKGPSAGSEAETRTMITWSESERFAKVIDYHSYGREVLYAYRCLSHPFTAWMQQEAAALSQASGYGGHTRVPSAEGEHQQWQFAKLGAYAFLIETHTEFQPSYDSALAEAAMVWPGILSVLERPISVSGHVTDATTGAPLAAKVELLGVAFSNGETNSSGGVFGKYYLFLPAGTYNVRFSRDGYAPVVRTVAVTATSAEVVDVQLSPVTEVFSDTFETDNGWTRNPAATDTATSGAWERGDPQSTSSSGMKQLGTTVSGVNDLVTGRLSGSSSGSFDLDGGRTSMQSPAIVLPASGTLTMTFSYYLAHGSNSSSADYLRVSIVGTTQASVFQELGDSNDDDGVWATATVDLSAFAGQTIRILVEAADASGASLVEAAIDDVKIVRQ